MKRLHKKAALLSVPAILAAVLLLCLLWPVVRSAANVRYLEEGLYSMEEVRDVMDSVSKHNFDSVFASTEWSIVFDQTNHTARYYHREDFEHSWSFEIGG